MVAQAKLSCLFNAIDSKGVIPINGHHLQGQSYVGKIIVYGYTPACIP
ncbi:MAG TPA: DUF126 domain-containing protein [Nitrospirae bacterium]|nr:DUF126 domain-containing protein [Nitrospirota bacterium]